MSFTKNVEFTFNKTSANGISLGEETQIIETTFMVRTAYITDAGATADLFSSFDGVSWQLYSSYEFIPSYTSGVNILEQAEKQIQAALDTPPQDKFV